MSPNLPKNTQNFRKDFCPRGLHLKRGQIKKVPIKIIFKSLKINKVSLFSIQPRGQIYLKQASKVFRVDLDIPKSSDPI